MSERQPVQSLTPEAANEVMPFNIVVGGTGHVLSCGRTIARLFEDDELVGKRFAEVFEFTAPVKNVGSVDEMRDLVGDPIRLRFRQSTETAFRGIIVPLAESDNLLVNLSPGVSIVETVKKYGLSGSDFAPTDLAVELLYLLEAKNVVMQESHKLNLRLHGARAAAEEQANSDALTGLRNRRALDDALAELVYKNVEFGLMLLDLDHFKAVNDTYGHAAGDAVLTKAADILASVTRDRDIVARAGGDEFVLVFVGRPDAERLAEIGSRLIEKLEQPIPFEGVSCRISASVGVTVTSFYDSPEIEQMFADADTALYYSKRSGRGKATVWSPDMVMDDKSAI